MRITAANRHGRRAVAAIATLGVSVAVSACGGGGGDGAKPAAASPAKAGTTIDMVDLKFEPAALTVERGQTVTFVNRGKVTHNAKGKDFFSRVVEPGGSYRHTFDRAGTFAYVCTFHPGMDGTVTVR
jgi:plastocyanin